MSDLPFRVCAPESLRVEIEAEAEGRRLVRLVAESDCECCISLHQELSDLDESAEPWWLVPGCFYGQGCADTGVRIPRWGRESRDWVRPQWRFAVDRMAYPLVAVMVDRQWRGLQADPHYRLLDQAGQELVDAEAFWGDIEPQLGFGFGLGERGLELSLHLPANEGPLVNRRRPVCDATDRTLKLRAGMSIEFRCRTWQAESESCDDRRAVHAFLRQCHADLSSSQSLPRPVPHRVTMENATHGLLAWHWVEEPGYMAFTTAFDRCQEFNANNRGTSCGWHFEASGFIGAMQTAFALLWQSEQPGGNLDGRRIALKTMGRWCREGVAPNGLFRGSFHPGKIRTAAGMIANPAPKGAQNEDPTGDTPFYGSCWLADQNTLHARTAADATLYLARFAKLLGEDHEFYSTARLHVRDSAAAALRLQRDDGCFGFIYDLAADSVREWEGEAGLWWIAALGEAYELFEADDEFCRQMLDAMRKAGHFYAKIHTQRCSAGAPEDTRLAVNSESPQGGVMGYRLLHQLDPEGPWLTAWRDSADWLLTFQKVFNQRFSPYSILSAHELRTFGTQYASTQNNQIHCFGLQCLGDLIRLSQVSGDSYYADRAREHAAFSWQMLCRAAGHWGGQRGMCTEQFYICDWSVFDRWHPGPHHQQKGTLMGSSHSWCVTFMLLGLEQLASVGELIL